MGGHVARMGQMINVFKTVVLKPKGKRQVRKPSCRQDNIKMDLRETGFGGVDWIHMAKDGDQWQALVNMIMNL